MTAKFDGDGEGEVIFDTRAVSTPSADQSTYRYIVHGHDENHRYRFLISSTVLTDAFKSDQSLFSIPMKRTPEILMACCHAHKREAGAEDHDIELVAADFLK